MSLVPSAWSSLAGFTCSREQRKGWGCSLAGDSSSAVLVTEGLSPSPGPDTPHEKDCGLGRSSRGGTCSLTDI